MSLIDKLYALLQKVKEASRANGGAPDDKVFVEKVIVPILGEAEHVKAPVLRRVDDLFFCGLGAFFVCCEPQGRFQDHY